MKKEEYGFKAAIGKVKQKGNNLGRDYYRNRRRCHLRFKAAIGKVKHE